ncbi:MAG: ABC transporter ATP-binding protein [Sedimentisphaerales bacterium]|nr:ABC transporter ATP-binding protein [Sedimentisphaerales bacterium]
MQTIVKLKNVTFERDGRTILDDISWTIEQSQHWAILGANGSGKTTLLKIIAGYEWPTSGSVEVFGQRYGGCNLPELRKHIGWVSTAIEHKLPEDDSSLEIVASGIEASVGLYREFTEHELKLARDMLAMVNAQNYAAQKFGTLSQGEQQRVLIARALVNRPSLLILDEPCVGLDPAAKERFLADLSRLANRPDTPTMVMVTHHIEEIDPWISWVMAIKNGEILASGRKSELLNTVTLSRTFGMDMLVKKEGLRYYINPL